MSCEKCLLCSMPLKTKGIIMSTLLVLTAIVTSILTYTTNCNQVAQISGNSTQTMNEISSASRGVSISLVFFSVASAIFERSINKKLADAEEEVEELKSQLSISRSQNNTQREWYQNNNNEPIQPIETRRSEETVYPPAVSFQQYFNRQ